jgi:DNA-binding transcriptional MerR regulator
VGQTTFSIAFAATSIHRTPATLRRWERTGRFRKVRRDGVTRARRYSQADLVALKRLVRDQTS